jgi:hypothetical protein
VAFPDVPIDLEHTWIDVVVEDPNRSLILESARDDTLEAVVVGPAAGNVDCAALRYPCTEYSAALSAAEAMFAAAMKK